MTLTNSKRNTLLAIILLLSFGGVSINAQKPKKSDPCAEPQSQAEMNQCAINAYKAADAVLNQVYRQLVTKLDDEEKLQLRDAQNAWIKYRDADCDFVADQYKGGTMRPMIYAGCLEDVTKKRTTELRTQIEDRSH